jgi:hypothetical protein
LSNPSSKLVTRPTSNTILQLTGRQFEWRLHAGAATGNGDSHRLGRDLQRDPVCLPAWICVPSSSPWFLGLRGARLHRRRHFASTARCGQLAAIPAPRPTGSGLSGGSRCGTPGSHRARRECWPADAGSRGVRRSLGAGIVKSLILVAPTPWNALEAIPPRAWNWGALGRVPTPAARYRDLCRRLHHLGVARRCARLRGRIGGRGLLVSDTVSDGNVLPKNQGAEHDHITHNLADGRCGPTPLPSAQWTLEPASERGIHCRPSGLTRRMAIAWKSVRQVSMSAF